VTGVDDEPSGFEGSDADAASAAAIQRRCQLSDIGIPTVCTANGDKRRERGPGTAPQPDVSRQRFEGVDGDAVDAEQLTAPARVALDERIFTDNPVGGFGFENDTGRIERDTDTAVESLVRQREVLKPNVESGTDIDTDTHYP